MQYGSGEFLLSMGETQGSGLVSLSVSNERARLTLVSNATDDLGSCLKASLRAAGSCDDIYR